MCDSQRIDVNNEFARIRIELDKEGNGQRVKITSVFLGREICLDPLQLESLTWQDTDTFTKFLKTPFGPET